MSLVVAYALGFYDITLVCSGGFNGGYGHMEVLAPPPLRLSYPVF